MFTSKSFAEISALTMLSKHQLERMANRLEQPFEPLQDEEQIEALHQAHAFPSDLYQAKAGWPIQLNTESPYFISINTSQDLVKTALFKTLKSLHRKDFCRPITNLSIDDVYSSHAEHVKRAVQLLRLNEQHYISGIDTRQAG